MDATQQSVPDYASKRDDFNKYYDENRDRFRSAGTAVEALLRLLAASSGLSVTKVSSRLKDRRECINKFDNKYRTQLEKDGNDYVIHHHLTDIIGIRIICLHESDIEKVATLIGSEFNVLKKEDKSEYLYEKARFGYKGVHLDVEIAKKRSKLPEYLGFADLRMEIQIRSIVQDAWSEVDHRLKYKKQVPEQIQRRIVRLAALFELADQEFEYIKNLIEKREGALEAEGEPSESADADAHASSMDAISFHNFVQRRYVGYNFEPEKIDGFVDEIKDADPNLSIVEFKRIFDSNYNKTQAYRIAMREKFNINPFTHIRLMLYLFDKQRYGDFLYSGQKHAFDRWCHETSLDE